MLRHYELKSCIGGDVMKLTMTIVDSKNSVLKTDTERHEENEALKNFPDDSSLLVVNVIVHICRRGMHPCGCCYRNLFPVPSIRWFVHELYKISNRCVHAGPVERKFERSV